MDPIILTNVYLCTIEILFTGGITVWYGIYSTSNCKVLQRVLRIAELILVNTLPDIEDLPDEDLLDEMPDESRPHPVHKVFSRLLFGTHF